MICLHWVYKSLFRRSNVPNLHKCSDGSLFRRFIVPKVCCSEMKVHCFESLILFRRCIVPEGLLIRNRGSVLRRSIDPKMMTCVIEMPDVAVDKPTTYVSLQVKALC